MHGGRALLSLFGHPRFEFVRGDIRDSETIARAVEGVDAVVHLAAIVGDPACAREPGARPCRQRADRVKLILAPHRPPASSDSFLRRRAATMAG